MAAITFPEKVLIIDENYLKKCTAVNKAVDVNLIYSQMYVAQSKLVQPYLGTSLYEKILSDIAGDTLTGVYLALVQNYVADMCCWWTMVELIPKLTYKYDNGSLGQRTSEDTTPISDLQMKDEMDRARQNAEYYTGLLIDYLCTNSSDFPEYSNNTSPQRSPVKSLNAGSAYVFSNGNTAMSNTRTIKYSELP